MEETKLEEVGGQSRSNCAQIKTLESNVVKDVENCKQIYLMRHATSVYNTAYMDIIAARKAGSIDEATMTEKIRQLVTSKDPSFLNGVLTEDGISNLPSKRSKFNP
jgi:predicted enzyme involved in methoxymalonyl-ACP biosynthesis